MMLIIYNLNLVKGVIDEKPMIIKEEKPILNERGKDGGFESFLNNLLSYKMSI